jgi:nucleoside-diphosphate-sugar epimerase
VFLSSIRAQCGPAVDMVLTEALEPKPTDAYGKSKLAAERGLAQLDIDWISLRLPLVYGRGVEGNMAKLMRVARSPLPLPFGSLRGRRSLLAVENLLAAIEAVLAAPGTLQRVFIAADPQALTVGEMIEAMRAGLGRKPNVFPLPSPLLELLFRGAGRTEIYERLSGSLVADPSALMSLAWVPPLSTPVGLYRLMEASVA